MRVLIAVPSLDRHFGGPVVKVMALATALRQAGAQVSVVGASNEPMDGANTLPYSFRYHGTPWPRGLGQVRRAVREADIVHVVGFRDPVGTIAALSAARCGVAYLIEPAGMLRRRGRSALVKSVFDATLGRRVLARARRIVVTSELERREVTEFGVDPSRIAMRPNGVTAVESLPLRGGLRQRLGIPEGAPLVIAIGRIAEKKGLLPLVYSVAALPGVHVVIAGPSDADGTLEQLLAAREALGERNRIHLRPDGLWGDAKVQAYVDADICCLYSRHENFGQAALEAGSHGLPVVVSDRVGAAEFLGDGCVVVPIENPTALTATLGRLCTDAAERARIGAAARAAAERLSWNTVAAAQLSIYAEALA